MFLATGPHDVIWGFCHVVADGISCANIAKDFLDLCKLASSNSSADFDELRPEVGMYLTKTTLTISEPMSFVRDIESTIRPEHKKDLSLAQARLPTARGLSMVTWCAIL